MLHKKLLFTAQQYFISNFITFKRITYIEDFTCQEAIIKVKGNKNETMIKRKKRIKKRKTINNMSE